MAVIGRRPAATRIAGQKFDNASPVGGEHEWGQNLDQELYLGMGKSNIRSYEAEEVTKVELDLRMEKLDRGHTRRRRTPTKLWVDLQRKGQKE